MTPELRKRFQPDGTRLLTMLSDLMDDDMLREVSEADFGSKAEENLEKLKIIKDSGVIEAPIDSNLKEVLELMRWDEPDQPYGRKAKVSGKKGHIVRAFCCAALLKVGGDPARRNFFEGENSTIAQLVVSLGHVGIPYQEASISLFAWRLENFCIAEDPPFFWFAILVTALKIWPNTEVRLIGEVIQLLIDEEQKARDCVMLPDEYSQEWLIGLTFFMSTEEIWRSFGQEIADLSEKINDADVKENLLLVASLLSHNSSLPPDASRRPT